MFPKDLYCRYVKTGLVWERVNSFPNDKFYTLSNLKEFADDNFKFYENGGKVSRRIENTVGKREVLMRNFYFSHSVFKGLVQQTRKNKGLFGKGLSPPLLFAGTQCT